eukprot:CAMPEP_0179200708 /NCGR_PEP_ID=MMETSP0796-20121207/99887_1 /TAXON_ID=73915 /ORGANISM="Pyrodinium bahamense, Strain pbaha01" /LENGTH=216 /DNA_ID=CAMNT_0020905263 /DNA_START=350 /DNA_END=1001 /DNA_ORIENTATION=-
MPAHAAGALQQVLAALEVLTSQEQQLPVWWHVPQAFLQQAFTESRVESTIILDDKEWPQRLIPPIPQDDVLPDEDVRQGATNRSWCEVKAKQFVAVWQEIPLLRQICDKPSLREGLDVHTVSVHRGEAPGLQAQAPELPPHELPPLGPALQVDAVRVLEELVPPVGPACAGHAGDPSPGHAGGAPPQEGCDGPDEDAAEAKRVEVRVQRQVAAHCG